MAVRFLRVMCDYSAHGLWTARGAVHPADLRLPAALVARLAEWQAGYERLIDTHATTGWDSHAAEGLQIAIAVKQALPGWQVIYFDDDRRDMAEAFGWPATGDWRGFFEYEIDAAVVASGQPPVWVEPSK